MDRGNAAALRAGVSHGEVFGLFRDVRDGLTKADVMRHSGLSRTAVNQRLDSLLAAGLLVPAPEEARTRGRPASSSSTATVVCSWWPMSARPGCAPLCATSGARSAQSGRPTPM
ncbi:hypothetical protein GCM10029978_007700 [Actinoallomurus acanthiterrae]